MRLLLTTAILLLGIAQLCAQDAMRILPSAGLEFPNGFHAYEADDQLYFNALHPSKGFQLYLMDGERIECISNFKKPLEKKEEPEGLDGAQTGKYQWFNNQVYFFASGKGTPSGIYAYNGYQLRQIFLCSNMSKSFVTTDRVIATHAAVRTEDTTLYYHVAIDEYQKIRRIPIDSASYCSEITHSDESFYGIAGGKLGSLSELGSKVYWKPLKDVPNGDTMHVENLERVESGIVCVGYNNHHPTIMHRGHDGKWTTKTFNEHYGGERFIGFQPSLKGYKVLYYIVHNRKNSELVECSGSAITGIGELPRFSEFTGATSIGIHPIFSVTNGIKKGIYQIVNGKLVKREMKSLEDANYVAQHEGKLIFMANYKGAPSLYKIAPLLPPVVHNVTYNVFDFWKKGQYVGKLPAQSQNEDGKLHFEILSGDKNEVFEINTYTGVISVNKHRYLKASNKKTYKLEVEVSERRNGTSIAYVTIQVRPGQKFEHDGLVETLMFFPDFDNPGRLTTSRIPDGESVLVYDMKFEVVDILTVKKGTIVLGSYPPGMYILNVRNKENLYQKLEVH